MTRRRITHPEQIMLDIGAMLPADRARFETAVAAEAERRAFFWRFRLVATETVMMAGLVLIAGLLVDLPTQMAFRASMTVGAACLGSGLLLMWLSSVASGLMLRWRQR